MPALDPSLRIGVAVTVQVRPASSDRNTRAAPRPPVANQTCRSPITNRQLLLAANAPSSESAAGPGCGVQCSPPSTVLRTTNLPSTGSPITIPCCESQKATASKNPLGSGLVNCRVQCEPLSRVL